MKIKVTLDQSDYQQFLRFVIKRAKNKSRSSSIIIAMIVGAMAGFVLINLIPAANEFLVLLGGFFGGVITLMLLARATQKRLCPQDQGYILGEQEIETCDEGIRIRSQFHDALFRWSLVRNPVLTGDHVFIMLDRIAGIIVPRRSFVSEEARQTFMEEIRLRGQFNETH